MPRPCNLHVFGALLSAFAICIWGQVAHGQQPSQPGKAIAPPTPSPINSTLERPVRVAISRPVWKSAVATGMSYWTQRQDQGAQPFSYSVGASFQGLGNGFPNYQVTAPVPDANIAVGDTQLLQVVDQTFVVFSRTGTILAQMPISELFIPLGGSCPGLVNGQPIAQFDNHAHRWVIVQNVLTQPYAVCIAVSTSSDASGTYALYQFPVMGNVFPDYQKFGIWSVGWYQTMNNLGPLGNMFLGALVCGYNSTKLLAGDPTAEQICFQTTPSDSSLLPADIDSATLPPTGQDEFFIGSVGAVDNSHLSLYSMHINNPNDWSQGATFAGSGNSQLLSIAAFTPACNPNYMGECVPQSGVADLLLSLGDRLMYRFAYFADSPGGFSSIPVAALAVFQQGTLAVPDGNSRWMGSIAGNANGDILLGYSSSGATQFPSIAVSGRLLTDPLGTLEPELTIRSGTGSQQSSPWGSYTSMRIDPADNCTFWYTSEYYQATAPNNWSTQIASIAFPQNCGSQQPMPRQHWYVNFDVGLPGGAVGTRWMELVPQLIPTETTVTSGPNNPSTYFQPVTITALVAGNGATGTVDFTDTFNEVPTSLCSGVPLDNGMATCTTSILAVGTHDQLVAQYSGDGQFDGSQGTDTPPQVVEQALTTTVVAADPPSPSMFGQSVTFTATVTGMNGGIPTGTVDFFDNQNPIPGCTGVVVVAQMSGSNAICQTGTLSIGQHSICAFYNGDSNFQGSSSCAPYEVVPAAADFSIAITPGSGTVTQSFSNETDPFFAHVIDVTLQPIGGYNLPVSFSCSVPVGSSCAVTPQQGPPYNPRLTINVGATMSIGPYIVTVTAKDSQNLQHSATFNLTVINLAPDCTMAPGGACDTPLIFTGEPGPPVTFSCPLVTGTGLSGQQPFGIIGGNCVFNPQPGTIPGPIMGTFSGCTVAELRRHAPIYATLFFGFPGMVLLGSLRFSKRSRKRLVQIASTLLVIGTIAMAMACGTGSGGQLTPTGHYYVLVQGVGPDGIVHPAVVPITVRPLQN
jgi:hypothetical protein